MNAPPQPRERRIGSLAPAMLAGLCVASVPSDALALSCRLPSQHAGLSFPVERIDPAWPCRLEPILTNYTTANKIGPVVTPLSRSLYEYLLDHPPVAAALVNRLELGLHKSELREQERFWVTDGEGTEAVVDLVHQDRHGAHTVRLYYLEGTHDGRFLPAMSGTAVVLLWIRSAVDASGHTATETTMVAYLRVNNRVVSGLLSLLRPLVGRAVMRQVGKAFDTAARLGRAMRHDPARVLFEATDPPALPDEAVAVLHGELAGLHTPGAPAIPAFRETAIP